MTTEYLTAQEVADALRFHVNTIYEKAQTGEIPVALRVGRYPRFDLDAVVEALQPKVRL